MKLLFWDFVDSLLPYLPFAVLIAALYSFYKAWHNRKGGYEQKIKDKYGNVKWVTGEGLLPVTKIPAFWFGIILTAFALIIFIWMQLEK